MVCMSSCKQSTGTSGRSTYTSCKNYKQPEEGYVPVCLPAHTHQIQYTTQQEGHATHRYRDMNDLLFNAIGSDGSRCKFSCTGTGLEPQMQMMTHVRLCKTRSKL